MTTARSEPTELHRVEPSDVTVEDYKPPSCENCDEAVTKVVVLDLRAVGTKVCVGMYCAACAEEFANRIRAGHWTDGAS